MQRFAVTPVFLPPAYSTRDLHLVPVAALTVAGHQLQDDATGRMAEQSQVQQVSALMRLAAKPCQVCDGFGDNAPDALTLAEGQDSESPENAPQQSVLLQRSSQPMNICPSISSRDDVHELPSLAPSSDAGNAPAVRG